MTRPSDSEIAELLRELVQFIEGSMLHFDRPDTLAHLAVLHSRARTMADRLGFDPTACCNELQSVRESIRRIDVECPGMDGVNLLLAADQILSNVQGMIREAAGS